MEIFFISHKYPPTIGGMEKQSFELIAAAQKNHTVHQLVFTGEGESKFSFFLNLKKRVKKILRQNPGIEIIHLNDGLMGLFSLWLKSYTSIPVVVTFHGLDLVFPNRVYQNIITRKFIRYDGFICVSSATASECLNRNIPSEKIFVVPNGVDHQLADLQVDRAATMTRFKSQFGVDISDKKIITTLGRPVKRKGFSWFLQEVLPHLRPDVLLLMMGPVSAPKKKSFWNKLIPGYLKSQFELMLGGLSDEETIRTILSEQTMKNRVIQTGKLPLDLLMQLLSIADLFVMPNIKMPGDAEGFGLVALEASLCKTVVLASNLEGIPEAIQDGGNGYLLPSGQPEPWIKMINALLEDSQSLKEMGAQFQQFTLDHYGWEKMTAEYLEVFATVVSRNSKAS